MLAGIAWAWAESPAAIVASVLGLASRVAGPPIEPPSQPMNEAIYQERQCRREQRDGINLVAAVILHGVVDYVTQSRRGDHPFGGDRHDDRAGAGDLLRRHDRGNGIGQADLAEGLPPARIQDAHPVEL